MEFTGRVIATSHMDQRNPSVLVKAFHDPSLKVWAEWQTDLKGRHPIIGDVVRIRSSDGIKIAF